MYKYTPIYIHIHIESDQIRDTYMLIKIDTDKSEREAGYV